MANPGMRPHILISFYDIPGLFYAFVFDDNNNTHDLDDCVSISKKERKKGAPSATRMTLNTFCFSRSAISSIHASLFLIEIGIYAFCTLSAGFFLEQICKEHIILAQFQAPTLSRTKRPEDDS